MRIVVVLGLLFSLVATAGATRARYVEVAIELRHEEAARMPVERLHIAADYIRGNAVSIELVLEDRLGRQTFTTPRDQLNLSEPALRLAPGHVIVHLATIDGAGTRTPAGKVELDVRAQRYRCGLGPMILFLGRALLGLVLVMVVIAVFANTRLRKGDGEPLSLLVADEIARTVQRRLAGVCVAMLVGALTTAALYGSLLSLLLFGLTAVPFSHFLAAQRVARDLERDGASAELRDYVLVVRSPNGQAHVAGSHRVIERARRRAVPTSIAR